MKGIGHKENTQGLYKNGKYWNLQVKYSLN